MDLKNIFSRINRFGLEVYGHYYSSYPAYVVENEDPKNMKRLLLHIPSIMGLESHPLWAYSKSVSPRVNDLPQVGDMVWVEFLNGRLETATWTHYYPLKGENAPEFKHPKCYGYKSPAGYLVLIDELEKTFLIQTPTGLSRKFTEDSIIDNAEKIFLTSPEADQKVPKGQEMDSDIKSALDEIKGVLEKVLEFSTTQATASAATPLSPLTAGYTNLASNLSSSIPKLVNLIKKFEDESHLSEKVKLT